MRADNMARELCEKDMVEFWKSVRTLSNSKIANSTCINGTYGESNIAQQWKSYFENILNSVNDEYAKESVLSHLQHIDFNNDMYVTCNEIQQAFTELKSGKAAGPDGIFTELLIYASQKLIVFWYYAETWIYA